MRFSEMKEVMSKGAGVAAAIILSLLLFNITLLQARAQEETGLAAEREAGQEANEPGGRRHNLMRELNLSAEQIGQIKAIREQNKEEWRAARQRMRQAQRSLDEAIYSDNADEAVIEERAQEAAAAQAALLRMRALTELKIRRVLTREQLNTLRSLRQQREAARDRRSPNDDGQPRPRWHRGGPFRGQRP
jgi:Spy/CpxP family protein refolding chaperone